MTLTIEIPDDQVEATRAAFQNVLDAIDSQQASAETPAPEAAPEGEAGTGGLGSLMGAGKELDAMGRASGR